MIDQQTLALMATVATASAGSSWYIGKIIRGVEKTVGDKLDKHETEDRRIFQEHGLRLQRLEIGEFGFTGAGKDAVNNPLPE